MTGYDVYKRVCALLGYDAFPDVRSDNRSECMTEIMNEIAADLKMENIINLSAEIEIEPKKAEALIYGTAMMMAVRENDGGHAHFFADLYNSKRSAALSGSETRQDVLPKSGLGVM